HAPDIVPPAKAFRDKVADSATQVEDGPLESRRMDPGKGAEKLVPPVAGLLYFPVVHQGFRQKARISRIDLHTVVSRVGGHGSPFAILRSFDAIFSSRGFRCSTFRLRWIVGRTSTCLTPSGR